MSNPFDVVRDFEAAVCEYTGAPYCVTTNSCTMALLLACRLFGNAEKIEIPKRTYVSVPMSIWHAGHKAVFRDEDWSGSYQLKPLPIWDSARRFHFGMYHELAMISEHKPYICVSFHASKILGDTQGGAILHANEAADEWFRRARFDGRTEGVAPKDDIFEDMGWHCYMSPDVAARLLLKLYSLPKNNPDLPNDDYPDLSKLEIFQ